MLGRPIELEKKNFKSWPNYHSKKGLFYICIGTEPYLKTTIAWEPTVPAMAASSGVKDAHKFKYAKEKNNTKQIYI